MLPFPTPPLDYPCDRFNGYPPRGSYHTSNCRCVGPFPKPFSPFPSRTIGLLSPFSHVSSTHHLASLAPLQLHLERPLSVEPHAKPSHPMDPAPLPFRSYIFPSSCVNPISPPTILALLSIATI
ncbi:hypothetical protein AMTR_s00115p00145700 [Amborella trichopoda]|uniref:Uncharacterized protein n=1 Tax=Amborella trichopoda TaxID=13333 RepID=W1NQW6_AMBTC|nr:hypothetical protein AMTR_s00115p00145700 [Amborella trichopoda]